MISFICPITLFKVLTVHPYTRETIGTTVCPRAVNTATITATSTSRSGSSSLLSLRSNFAPCRNGSCYYHNFDGSRYYNDGKGYSRTTTSEGKVTETYGGETKQPNSS